jgi:selenocysteine lyase/cysteine desulfurase
MDLIEPPFIDLHAATWTGTDTYEWQPDASRFETWEGNVAGKIGMGVAVDYALELGIDATWKRLQYLGAELRDQLSTIPSVTVHDLGRVKGGIVTFSSASRSSEEIKAHLASHKINVVTSTPEYARLDAEHRSLPVTVRASVHYYNTGDEIAHFIAILSSLLS